MSTYIQWHHKYSSLKVLFGHKTLAQSSSRTKLIHSEAVCIPGICADSGSLVVEAVLVEPTMKGAASSSWHEQKRWWNSPSLSAAELNNWKKFRRQIYHNSFFKKIASPGLFFVYFWSFETNKQYNFYHKSILKNVHPVSSGAGIQTHDLLSMSRLA